MEFKELSEQLQSTLTEFRSYVDREIKEIKANGVAAPETKDALDRLNKRIDELQAKMERPALGKTENGEKSEYRKAFETFARKGDMAGVEKAAGDAMNATLNSGVDGGVAVPAELDRNVYSLQQNMSPIRGIATVIQVSGTYSKIVNKHGAASGWVDEDDARTATATPILASLSPYMGELYAFPQATQTILDDAFFNVEQFLTNELADAFSIAEGTAFVTGTGTKQPKGFMAYTMASTADGVRAFGSVQYVPTGVSAGWPASNPQDVLTDLEYSLKAAHRQGARYVTNKAVLATIRKFKDGNGNALWQPSMQAGQPSTINGYPVTECEDIAAIGANSYSLAFGNFPRAYYIVDRIGTRILRDPFTNKPYVGFYATRRVGGMLVDSEAIKTLKFGVS